MTFGNCLVGKKTYHMDIEFKSGRGENGGYK